MFLVKKSEAKSPIVITDEKRDTGISWFYWRLEKWIYFLVYELEFLDLFYTTTTF